MLGQCRLRRGPRLVAAVVDPAVVVGRELRPELRVAPERILRRRRPAAKSSPMIRPMAGTIVTRWCPLRSTQRAPSVEGDGGLHHAGVPVVIVEGAGRRPAHPTAIRSRDDAAAVRREIGREARHRGVMYHFVAWDGTGRASASVSVLLSWALWATGCNSDNAVAARVACYPPCLANLVQHCPLLAACNVEIETDPSITNANLNQGVATCFAAGEKNLGGDRPRDGRRLHRRQTFRRRRVLHRDQRGALLCNTRSPSADRRSPSSTRPRRRARRR